MNNININQLPTEQLEEMLENTLCQNQPDEKLARQILKELEQRSELANIDDPAVQTAWRNYVQACEADKKQCAKQRAHIHRKWALGAVAATVALFLILAVAPQRASAESFWERLARWTDTVFAFINTSDKQEGYTYTTDHPGLQQVYDTVTELGVTQPVVPMWIPEEYELTALTVNKQPAKVQVYAQFAGRENNLIYRVDIHKEFATYNHSKNSDCVGTYENSGVTHYLLNNGNTMVATWVVENIECSICIDGQENMICDVLDSIYEMEDD